MVRAVSCSTTKRHYQAAQHGVPQKPGASRHAASRQRTVARTDAQITDLRNKRDVIYDRLWDKTKRVRNAVKGLYGDDSSEYEMVGGKRISERKPPVRKPKTA